MAKNKTNYYHNPYRNENLNYGYSGGYGNWGSRFSSSGSPLGGFFSRIFGSGTSGSGAGSGGGSGSGGESTGSSSGLFSSGRFIDPSLTESLRGFGHTLSNPRFGWNPNTGLTGWGKNIGGGLTAVNAGIQGFRALNNLSELSEARDGTGDVISDILSSSYNSPTLQYDLNSEQLKLLRELRNGRYDTDTDLGDLDLMGILADAGKGALMGAPGGWIGALVGGVGGALNSGIEDLRGGVDADNAELQALYDAILNSEQQYKQLEKQKAYARLYGG